MCKELAEKRIKKYERWIKKRAARMSEKERDAQMIAYYEDKIKTLKEMI